MPDKHFLFKLLLKKAISGCIANGNLYWKYYGGDGTKKLELAGGPGPWVGSDFEIAENDMKRAVLFSMVKHPCSTEWPSSRRGTTSRWASDWSIERAGNCNSATVPAWVVLWWLPHSSGHLRHTLHWTWPHSGPAGAVFRKRQDSHDIPRCDPPVCTKHPGWRWEV